MQAHQMIVLDRTDVIYRGVPGIMTLCGRGHPLARIESCFVKVSFLPVFILNIYWSCSPVVTRSLYHGQQNISRCTQSCLLLLLQLYALRMVDKLNELAVCSNLIILPLIQPRIDSSK